MPRLTAGVWGQFRVWLGAATSLVLSQSVRQSALRFSLVTVEGPVWVRRTARTGPTVLLTFCVTAYVVDDSSGDAKIVIDRGTCVCYHDHMLATDVVDVVREVVAADPATCDSSDLAALAADVHRLRCWLDSVDAAVVARSRELALASGRRSSREADIVAERAAVCAAMPEVHAALAAGTLSAGHADAIARAGNRLDADEREELAAMAPTLVADAANMSVDVFARKVRDLARRISRDEGLRHHEKLRSQRTVKRWMDREGMCRTQISLDPEADARLSAAFDAAVAAEKAKPDDGRSFDQIRADAFMTMVTAAPVPGARLHAELLVLIDLETLRDGLHDTGVCETYDGQPLPPAMVRRLACEADIIPIVLDGDGSVIDVGRAKRLASADQRRALRAMHQTCAAPDCPVRFGDCDIHHLTEWRHGGLTNLENLIPLCSKHHHLIHEGQWRPPARAPAA